MLARCRVHPAAGIFGLRLKNLTDGPAKEQASRHGGRRKPGRRGGGERLWHSGLKRPRRGRGVEWGE